MVRVQLRNTGDGLWRPMTLPTSVQLAQTVAGAAKTLNIADEIRVQPTPPTSQLLDIRV